MKKKIHIQRKYNKCINILLAIYVVLCLVLSLLYNGFFVKTKAYRGNFNKKIIFNTYSDNSNIYPNGVVEYTFTGGANSNCIFYVPDVDGQYYYLFQKPYTIGNNYNIVLNNGFGWYGSECVDNFNTNSINYLLNYNFSGSDLWAYRITNHKGFNSDYNGTPYTYEITSDITNDIEYVTTLDDVKAYLYNNDDSVVNIGNPFNPTEPIIDNSLPVPQNVHFLDNTIDKQTGEIYNLKIGWDNPSNASFDALESDKLKVQVQVNAKTYYVDGIVNKPSNRIYNNFDTNNEFDLFNPLMKQNLNAYFSRGSENDGQIKAKYEEGFGEFLDEGYCFYQDLKLSDEYRKLGAPSQRSQLIAGTTIKIRYKYEDNVSLWVNLRLSKNPTTWTDLPLYTDTSFTDNQDNNVEVSSDASGNGFYYNSNPYSPYYNSIVYPNPNSSNKSSNSSSSSSSSSGLGNILSGIGSIFGAIGEFFSGIFTGIGELVSSIKDLFSGENDSGGFFGFFGSLFQEFPFLLTFLTLGIAITVLLRIIGR